MMTATCSQCGQSLSANSEGNLCPTCAGKFAVHLANLGEDSTLGGHTMDGQSIAHYTITSKLGEGGMGEVYRATDAKLKRDVAIKILPDSMAGNAQVLSRFEREAEVLAKLNHPNIATIFGIEDVDGSKAIVMELVEGDTLGERLQKSAMSVEECLPVFRQIASALEAAHEKGIIHRDLKPGNIKFTADGQVKVLDFGLAKPTDGPASEDDTEADNGVTEMTMPGAVVGTPAYMSPEQTRGDTVDKRTDVWAFGCCLYESLAGRKPFKARTISDMMAEVLKSDPDFTLIPTETPNDILSLLRRCLEKEPRRRLRDIGDIAIRLEETTETSRMMSPQTQLAPSTAVEAGRGKRVSVFAGAMLVLGGILGWLISQHMPSSQTQASENIRSIAILPFDELKPDKEFSWLSQTMAEEILDKLNHVNDITVRIGRLPLKGYQAEGMSVSEVVAALNVDALVQGNFVHHQGTLKMGVSLRKGLDEQDISLGIFQRDAEDANSVFELQAEVAAAIAERIGINLNNEEKARLAESQDIVPEAYKAYRKAMEAIRPRTAPGFDEGERLFQEALRIDPGYGDAVGLLAVTPWVRTVWGGTIVTPEEAIKQSRRVLDKHRNEVRDVGSLAFSEGWLAMYGNRDWKKAERLFREGFPFSNSSRTDALASYLIFSEGRYEEALELIELALEHEPDSLLLLGAKAKSLAFAGSYQESIDVAKEIVKREPKSWSTLASMGHHLHQFGQTSEALKKVNLALSLSPDNPYCLVRRASIYAETGQEEEAREELAKLDDRGKSVYMDQVTLADVDAALGDFDKAFERLNLAASKKGGYGILNLRDHYRIKLYGQDPRYWDLIDRLEFPDLPVYHPYHKLEQKMRSGAGQIEQTDTIESLAILPFEGIGLDEERDLFATIMADELHEKLQVLDGVKIVKDWIPLKKRLAEGKSTAEVASLLKVDALVTGVIVEAQGKLKTTVDLHRADGSSPVLGSFYHGTEDQIFEVQTEVALAISEVLKSNLTEEEKDAIAWTDTNNQDAYKACQHSRQALLAFTSKGFAVAENHARNALAIDPGYGAPVRLLANLAWVRRIYERSPTTFKQGLEESRSILDEFTPNVRDKDTLKLVEGYLAKHQGQWQRAERFFREAAADVPIFGGNYAEYLSLIEGDYWKAIRWVDETFESYPSDLSNMLKIAKIYSFMGHYENSLEKITSILEQHPEHVEALELLSSCQLELGQTVEAMETIERAVSLSENNVVARVGRAVVWARSGEPEKAREELSKLDELAQTEFIDQGFLAWIEGALGNLEKGLDRLERLVTEGGWSIVALRTPNLIKVFGQEKRYWDLIDQLNFPELPYRHPSWALEQRMRYGKTPETGHE